VFLIRLPSTDLCRWVCKVLGLQSKSGGL
jgi:hypothetical protein